MLPRGCFHFFLPENRAGVGGEGGGWGILPHINYIGMCLPIG